MSRCCPRRSCPPACSTWGLPADDPRRSTTQVLNPLESIVRTWPARCPGLLEALGRNVSRGTVDVGLFAIAQVVEPTEQTRAVDRIPNDRRPTDDEIATLDASLPRQPQHVGVVSAGLQETPAPGVPVVPCRPPTHSTVRVIGRAAGVELTLRAAQYLPWHPGRCAEVLVGATVVGHAGQLHPAVVERAGLPKGACAVELNLDAIPITERLPVAGGVALPRRSSRTSPSSSAMTWRPRASSTRSATNGALLEDVRLFDVYTGPQIGEGPQVAGAGAAVPRHGPHADRGRGQRRPRCGRADRRRPRRRRQRR